MSTITWLHLSDWHQRGEEFDRRVVRDALMKDISRRKEISPDLAQIDFVVFSGDVTYHGRNEEYNSAAEEFFTPLLDAAGVGRDRLFIVPGNHDLNRDKLQILPSDLLQQLNTPKAVNEWLTSDKKRRKLFSPFADYARFISKYQGAARNAVPESSFSRPQRFIVHGKHVALIGLNTAWMSGRNTESDGTVNDYGHLILGEPQVYGLLEEAASADIRIAVMHHSLDWLIGFDRHRVAERLGKTCHFILHGHQHLPQVHILRGTSGESVIIPAGASYFRRVADESRYANAYNFVHLSFDTGQGTVYLRRYEDPQGWIRDTVTTGDETPGFFEFDLPSGERRLPRGKKGVLKSRGYEVKKLLAQGGTSAVWLASYKDEDVALKEFRPLSAANEQTIAKWKTQFENEYKILSGLRHSHIPRLREAFAQDDHYYLAMDYIEGVTLEERAKRLPVDEERILCWAEPLFDVLDFLHTQKPPVIFRDLNPSNIMLRKPDGKVMLIDFGIAKRFQDDGYRYATQTVLKMGTEGYMPPEQNSTSIYEEEGESGTDERSDIYALGATLYFLLTKMIPRDSVCRALDFRRFGQDGLTPPRGINPTITRNTEEVVQTALELCKEDRFQTIREFKQALFSPYPAPETILHPKDGSEMILIPEGEFWMGARDAGEDEKPRRKIRLDSYYIDKHPVTYGQFKKFVEETGYKRKAYQGDTAYDTEEWSRYYEAGRENYPVVNVTWHDARAYAEWAGKELPTEEQWEKAARGKNGILYPWGYRWDSRRCNSFLLPDRERISKMIPMWNGERGTTPVGTFPEGASPYGVMEMAGNVLQWTASDYGLPNAKAVRGGCWYRDAPSFFRCSKRYWYFSSYSVHWLGLRCILRAR